MHKKFSVYLKCITTYTLILIAAISNVNALSSTGAPAIDENKPKIKIGIVTFLSGAASGPFGIPAKNSAEVTIDAINNGTLPAPYNTPGFGGSQIEVVYIDENSSQTVIDYINLIEIAKVDLVIGYISSQNCKEVAQEAEKMKRLTVFFDCGTPQIFEEIVTQPKYLFRTSAHATMDSVGAARYVLDSKKNVNKIGGINQNYAWGQDSWKDFKSSFSSLNPNSQIIIERFPKIFAGNYEPEISELLAKQPQLIHSSFWGRDMESFLLQASASKVFSKSTVVLTSGESALDLLAEQIPPNTIIGGRGAHGALAPDNALNRWFTKKFFSRFGSFPTYPSYKMIQALLAVKSAYDNTDQKHPNQEAVIKELEGLKFETPSGTVHMAISSGHQAIQDTAYGTFNYDRSMVKPTLSNIKRYKASCVNPPKNVKSQDWIASGFKGAEC